MSQRAIVRAQAVTNSKDYTTTHLCTASAIAFMIITKKQGSDSSLTTHSASDPLIDVDDTPTELEGRQITGSVLLGSESNTIMHGALSNPFESMKTCDLAGLDAVGRAQEAARNITLDAAVHASSNIKDQDGFTFVTRSSHDAFSGKGPAANLSNQDISTDALTAWPKGVDQFGPAQRELISKNKAITAAELYQQQIFSSEPSLPADDSSGGDMSAFKAASGSKQADAPAGSAAAAADVDDDAQQKDQDLTEIGSTVDQDHDEKIKPRFKQGIGCPIGVRVFTDQGVDLSSRQNPFTEAFAVVTMAVYLGMIHLLLLLLVAAVFSRTALMVMIGLWCTLLLPAKLLWEPFLGNPVWTAWRRYFRFSVIMDADMELHNTQYVIPEYPHGVFPLSQLIAISLTWIWPHHPIYSIAADSVFHIPLWKHVMTWIGALPATRDNFQKLLTKGSVGLIPGGIAEMFMVEDNREVIKLQDRKGFVRIAVESGKPLLPCYHFGNSKLFKWGPKSWESAARRHRVALGFLFGRWGLPFALPNRVPLMMVVGAPIPVKQISPTADPQAFAAAVDEAHEKLIVAMQQLYDKYKAEYGWADRPLVIK